MILGYENYNKKMRTIKIIITVIFNVLAVTMWAFIVASLYLYRRYDWIQIAMMAFLIIGYVKIISLRYRTYINPILENEYEIFYAKFYIFFYVICIWIYYIYYWIPGRF